MRISRVVPHFDRVALSSDYQVFRIRSSSGRLGYADEAFDRLAGEAHVASVAFHGGGMAWVMVRRERPGATNAAAIRSALFVRRDLAFSEERLSCVDDRTLLQLCLNAVAGDDSVDAASNPCGRLIVVSLGRPHTEYFRGTAEPSAIHALEVSVSPQMELELRVRTFTSCAARRFKGSEPRFRLVDGRYFARALAVPDPDDGSLFCQGARRKGDRYGGFPLMDASGIDEFSRSKLGVLRSVLICLGEMFGDAVCVEFEEAEDVARVDCRASKLDRRLSTVGRRLACERVLVCDMDGRLASEASSVAEGVKGLFGVDVEVVDSPPDYGACLALVREKGSYGDAERDPYGCAHGGAVVQHMTPESGFTRTATAVASKELALKLDIASGRMSLFEWSWGAWAFAARLTDEGCDAFAFLDVSGDGSMSFEGPVSAIGASADHAGLVEALVSCRECRLAVRGPGGDVNAIGRTELFGIPDFDAVWRGLVGQAPDRAKGSGGRPAKHAIGRGKADRELYFADAVDIACCRTADGGSYYRVGLVGSGMQYSATHRASVLRRVETVGDLQDLTEKLLPMMDVCLVRWGQPTVIPFPFKYLREWTEMQGTPCDEDMQEA